MSSEREHLKLPPAFSGPAQFILYTRYDDPRTPGWGSKWLTTWHVQQLHPWFPIRDIVIHKQFCAYVAGRIPGVGTFRSAPGNT